MINMSNQRVKEAVETEQEAIKLDQQMLSSLKADKAVSIYSNEYKERMAKYQKALDERASRLT